MTSEQRHCLEVCGSRCCREFSLPHTLAWYRKRYDEWIRQDPEKEPYIAEIWLIYPMLAFVETRGTGPRRWIYRCKHLIDGRCSIYAKRPAMCSEFGVGYKAVYPDCIYAEGAPA